MNEMVCLRGHHALDVVLEIAQHDTEPLGGDGAGGSILGVEGLDLETLKDRNRKLLLGVIGFIENGAVTEMSELAI